MKNVLDFSMDGRIATVLIDNPPVNAESAAVLIGLAEMVDRFEANSALDVLVIRCAGRTFMAGADIKELSGPRREPMMPRLIDRIEACGKPVVAALHGTVLDGGLELAIGCHARIAAPGTRFGFPGIRLGLIPGAGGTQRTPRLAGLGPTIAMAVEGKELGAQDALAAGLIDRIAEGPLDEAAVAFARSLAGTPPRRSRDLSPPAADVVALKAAEASTRKRQRGQDAPLLALDAIAYGLDHPFNEAVAREFRLCQEAIASPQSQALRQIFLSERLVARPPSLDGNGPLRPVEEVAVVGLGTMGRGIVEALAAAGIKVVAIARNEAGVERARAAITKAREAARARGLLDDAGIAAHAALIRWAADTAAAASADLVIESIIEDRAEKEALFAELGAIAKPGAILASNTSYLDIDALGEASGRTADVCGLHFFNPADQMKLVECIQGDRTAPDVITTLMALARRLGKIGVVSGVCDGFIVNRMLTKRSREAYFLLEEGASPAAIDRVMVAFGFPLGPFALGDLAGIDVQHAARRARADRLLPREVRADFVDQLFAAGRLGRRNLGWYSYDADGRPGHDPEIDALVSAHSERHGVPRREVDDDEIRDRLLFAMVNEGGRLLDEGIVDRPHEIDVAMVNGIGFPRHLGGPMWWAQGLGLPKVAQRIADFRAAHGEAYWPVSPTLERPSGFY